MTALNMHPVLEVPMAETCVNDVHRVYFRAGLLACREYLARTFDKQDPAIAAAIRERGWPGPALGLGADPGVPRQLRWDEVAEGGEEGPWEPRDIDASVEALPVAAKFLNDLDYVAATATSQTTPEHHQK
jgi:hypothetical protein